MTLKTRLTTRQLDVLKGRRPRHISPAEREATYHLALCLLARIDPDGRRLVGHWRSREGRLLTHLDEVVKAILDNDLASTPAD